MQKFNVRITEKLETTVVVEADSKDEAVSMVEDMWRKGDIILDTDNFTGVEYTADDDLEIGAAEGMEM